MLEYHQNKHLKKVVKDHMSKSLKCTCTFVVASEVALRADTPKTNA